MRKMNDGFPAGTAAGKCHATDRELVSRIAERVVRLGLSHPAVLLLKTGEISSIRTGPAAEFFSNVASGLFSGDAVDGLVCYLDRLENAELLILEIEKREEEGDRKRLRERRRMLDRRFGHVVRRAGGGGGSWIFGLAGVRSSGEDTDPGTRW